MYLEQSNGTKDGVELTDPPYGQVYIGVAALARRYGVSLETVRSWRKRGKLPPAHRPSGALFWPIQAIVEWERQTKEAVSLIRPTGVKSVRRSLQIGRRKWS